MELSEDKLEEMLERASHKGAQEVLAKLGLEDEQAVEDIRSLRDLLSAFRTAKSTAWKATVDFITKGALIALLVGLILLARSN